jgi:hypothetical protein
MRPRERSFRGISVRLATEYLRGLGGEVIEPPGIDPAKSIDAADLEEPVVVAGEGWEARLTSETVSIGPSLSLTEVSVVFEDVGIGGDDGGRDDDIGDLGDEVGDRGPGADPDAGGDADGPPTALDDLIDRFAQKAVRAGG